MAKGIIYLMTTVVPGLVKIGKTKTSNFEERMRFLESNGYRNVSGLKRNFAIELENYDEKEVLLHDIFSKSRVGDTEMFSLDVNMVRQLLSSLDGRIVYPEEDKNEVFEQATEAVESSSLPNGNYEYKVKSKVDKQTYHGVLVVDKGVLTLKKGSTCAPISEKTPRSFSWVPFRNSLPLKNSELQEDVVCSSVSLAAAMVSGHNENGWSCWKDKDGNAIDIYRKKASEDEEE